MVIGLTTKTYRRSSRDASKVYAHIIGGMMVIMLAQLPRQSLADEHEFLIAQNKRMSKYDCAERSLTRAYTELGAKPTFVVLPLERALVHANSARTAAVAARVGNLNERFPNLIKIPVAICAIELRFFANKDITLTSLTDLKKYTLGIRRGSIASENYVGNYAPIYANDNDTLGRLLERNRIDIIVSSTTAARELRYKFGANVIRDVDFPSHTQYLYHWMHKNHRIFAQRLTNKLKELEKSGFLATVMAEHRSLMDEKVMQESIPLKPTH